MSLGGTATISTLAELMLPRLAVLCLLTCQLTHTDLDVLATRWPPSLHELKIKLSAFAPLDPADRHSLLRRKTRLAWAQALPPSLRIMDVQGMPVTDGIALALVKRMATTDPRDRLVIYVRAGWVSQIALVLRRTKFDVQEL